VWCDYGRLGTVVANGTITNATITASGVSSVYLIGLANYATVNLAGTANVYVKPSSGETPILHFHCYCRDFRV
jgi:hypothetical protein